MITWLVPPLATEVNKEYDNAAHYSEHPNNDTYDEAPVGGKNHIVGFIEIAYSLF